MSQLSVRSKTVVLFSWVAVPFSFVPVIMATERGTGLHGTPGCLHPRWVALSHGESAHANFTSLLLRLCTTCSLFKKKQKKNTINNNSWSSEDEGILEPTTVLDEQVSV